MKKSLSPRQIFERSITEEDVFGAIRNFLELHRARVNRITERIPYSRFGRKSEPGIPDLDCWFPKGCPTLKDSIWWPIALAAAIHFKIEVKKPGGNRRPRQIEWIRAAQDDGVIAFFAESVEDVIREFKNRGINL